MSIRNAAKAAIFKDNKILLNHCLTPNGTPYYTLPGGRQEQGETLEEAVIRECREETGYPVMVSHLLALYEELLTGPALAEIDEDYSHKVFFVFSCTVERTSAEGDITVRGDAPDAEQLGCEWIEVSQLCSLPFYPEALRPVLMNPEAPVPVFLGSARTEFAYATLIKQQPLPDGK